MVAVCAVAALALFMTATQAVAAEYAWDANTVLLEHFNGSHGGTAMWGAPDYVPSLAPLGTGARLDYTEDLLAYRPAGLPSLQGAGTIEMWVKMDEYPANGAIGLCELQWIWSPTPPSGGWVGHYTVCGNASTTDPPGRFTWSVWGAPTSWLGDGIIPRGQWVHLAVTWSDASGTTMYINGVPTAHTAAKVWPASPQVLYLGWWPQSSAFAPVLDEVRVSSVARTPAEIAAHVAGNSNQPPQIALDAASTACCEGSGATMGFTCTDADGDSLAVTSSSGTVLDMGGGQYLWSGAEAEGPFVDPVTISVDDGRGGTVSASFDVNVTNVVPECGPIVGPAGPVAIGAAATVAIPFSDAGVQDTHSALIDWGDGTSSAGVVSEVAGAGEARGVHSYVLPDVYTVTATVEDDDGGQTTRVLRYIVVYDPAGGFVTGGGTVLSPAGAYRLDPSLSGKANFGFVSKYQKGATVPKGNTEFVFHAAGMNFSSTSYEWLVIAGGKAQYKGAGTINGTGDYRFMLTAIDGQVSGAGGLDKIRLRIWDPQTDELVYDNQMGDALDADPTTVVASGSIVIHKAK